MKIKEDAKARVEWINKRSGLTELQKDYVEFQIKEAVNKFMREKDLELNIDNKDKVRPSCDTCVNEDVSAIEEPCIDCIYNAFCNGTYEDSYDNYEFKVVKKC